MQDEAGFFHFAARSDDMIVSAGYNIAGPEVEAALLAHAMVLECAVIGVADEQRGQIVEAHVVLVEGAVGDALTVEAPAGPCEGGDRALQISALGEVRRRPAQDADGQDPAVSAAGRGLMTRSSSPARAPLFDTAPKASSISTAIRSGRCRRRACARVAQTIEARVGRGC